MVSFGIMCLTVGLGGGGIFLVFKTNTINIFYFRLFIKLYTTVILLYLISIDIMVTTTSYDRSRSNHSRANINIEQTGNSSNSNSYKRDTYSNINKKRVYYNNHNYSSKSTGNFCDDIIYVYCTSKSTRDYFLDLNQNNVKSSMFLKCMFSQTTKQSVSKRVQLIFSAKNKFYNHVEYHILHTVKPIFSAPKILTEYVKYFFFLQSMVQVGSQLQYRMQHLRSLQNPIQCCMQYSRQDYFF